MDTLTTTQVESVGFLHKVFAWMCAGLLLTGGIAWFGSTSVELISFFHNNIMVFYGLLLVELALVFAIVGLINRISYSAAAGLFFLYSALNGLTFSLIFSIYTPTSIFATFLVAGGMFGVFGAYGALTKRDLSKFSSIIFMALIGLILASIVNLFWASSVLYWVVTYAGVVIFSALTAYDMQKIKKQHQYGAVGGNSAILGALTLYLDFVNLFLFLLRILGNQR